jgi:hypothetical protein
MRLQLCAATTGWGAIGCAYNWVRLQLGAATTGCGYNWVRLQLGATTTGCSRNLVRQQMDSGGACVYYTWVRHIQMRPNWVRLQYNWAVLWIRIRSDPKLLVGLGSGKIISDPDSSGSEMNLKKNYGTLLWQANNISQQKAYNLLKNLIFNFN